MIDDTDDITRNLAEISDEGQDPFLYTSYGRGDELFKRKHGDWAGNGNILLRQKEPIFENYIIRNRSSLDSSKLPPIERSVQVLERVIGKPQRINKSQILESQNKIKLVEVVLPIPKNYQKEQRQYEYRLACSLDKVVSNRLLRRRYRRKSQLEMINAVQEILSSSKRKEKVGNVYSIPKPLNEKHLELPNKIKDFKRAIRLRQEQTIIDLSTSRWFH